MDLAIRFCHSGEAEPSSQLALPVEIAGLFLDRLIGTTYDAVRLVPGLLDVGLLQVLFDDLFSHLQGRQSVYEWEGVGDKPTPLEMLSCNSHPLVVGALRRAVGSLPQATLDSLRNDTVGVRHLRCLLELLALYEEAFERYPESNIELCDSLEVRSSPASNSSQSHNTCPSITRRWIDLRRLGEHARSAHGVIQPHIARRPAKRQTGCHFTDTNARATALAVSVRPRTDPGLVLGLTPR